MTFESNNAPRGDLFARAGFLDKMTLRAYMLAQERGAREPASSASAALSQAREGLSPSAINPPEAQGGNPSCQ